MEIAFSLLYKVYGDSIDGCIVVVLSPPPFYFVCEGCLYISYHIIYHKNIKY